MSRPHIYCTPCELRDDSRVQAVIRVVVTRLSDDRELDRAYLCWSCYDREMADNGPTRYIRQKEAEE